MSLGIELNLETELTRKTRKQEENTKNTKPNIEKMNLDTSLLIVSSVLDHVDHALLILSSTRKAELTQKRQEKLKNTKPTSKNRILTWFIASLWAIRSTFTMHSWSQTSRQPKNKLKMQRKSIKPTDKTNLHDYPGLVSKARRPKNQRKEREQNHKRQQKTRHVKPHLPAIIFLILALSLLVA